MKQEKLDAALRAVSDVMVDELAGDEPDRFARVARIAVLANKLKREGAATVKDFTQQDGLIHGGQYAIGGVVMGDDQADWVDVPPAGPPRIYPARDPHDRGQDQMRMLRDLVGTLEKRLASDSRNLAEELRQLVLARKELADNDPAWAPITARIDEIVRSFQDEGVSENGEVVSAEFLRRHPAGVSGSVDAAQLSGLEPGGEGGDAPPDRPRQGQHAQAPLGG